MKTMEVCVNVAQAAEEQARREIDELGVFDVTVEFIEQLDQDGNDLFAGVKILGKDAAKVHKLLRERL